MRTGVVIARPPAVGSRPVGRRRVSILDTLEIRWFFAGPMPLDVWGWFASSTGVVEQRRDSYLVDGRVDSSAKRRGETTLELKVRRRVGPSVDLGDGLVGPLETWRKWSPADGLVEIPEVGSWIDVDKSIVKRRFGPDGTELAFVPDHAGDPACDVEVAEVRIGATIVWTLAFAAFGPPTGRSDNLGTAWSALRSSSGPTGLGIGTAMGYPEWIVRTLDADRDTLEHGTAPG